jgi:hypothetical protein
MFRFFINKDIRRPAFEGIFLTTTDSVDSRAVRFDIRLKIQQQPFYATVGPMGERDALERPPITVGFQ